MMRTLGADLVGMSTVPEAIAAHALGAEVLGISLVTNAAAGVTGEKLNHDEVIAAGKAAASSMGALLAKTIPQIV
jgi:purine-nucleoside phosphorylase